MTISLRLFVVSSPDSLIGLLPLSGIFFSGNYFWFIDMLNRSSIHPFNVSITQNLRIDFYIITFVNHLFVSVNLQFEKVCISCSCCMCVWFLPLLTFVNLSPFKKNYVFVDSNFLFTFCSTNINQSNCRYLNVSVIQCLFEWLGMRGIR